EADLRRLDAADIFDAAVLLHVGDLGFDGALPCAGRTDGHLCGPFGGGVALDGNGGGYRLDGEVDDRFGGGVHVGFGQVHQRVIRGKPVRHRVCGKRAGNTGRQFRGQMVSAHAACSPFASSSKRSRHLGPYRRIAASTIKSWMTRLKLLCPASRASSSAARKTSGWALMFRRSAVRLLLMCASLCFTSNQQRPRAHLTAGGSR